MDECGNSKVEGSVKVLVCDDERFSVRLVQLTLERAGHEVIVAYDGDECLRMLQDFRPDLLVLDIVMPNVDGLEVLRNIRSSEALADLNVILVTARAQAEEIEDGYRAGANLVLTKPFNPTELIRACYPVSAA
jgi:CheY-like chemotaxis protein